MQLDIAQLLDRYSIEYVEFGKNVKKGNINIKCPFCGNEDPSEHMGIELSTGKWGCWRIKSHRGTNLAWLLSRLLRISYKNALQLLGKDKKYYKEDDFTELAEGSYFKSDSVGAKSLKPLLLPDEFKSLKTTKRLGLPPSADRFMDYIAGRGFGSINAYGVVKRYGLMYAYKGDYKDRVIIPVTLDDRVLSFTSRSITDSYLRYKSLEGSKGENIKNLVYNMDNALAGGDVLFIVEGPVDCWKLDYIPVMYPSNMNYKCSAVALFNMDLQESQLYFLSLLEKLYDKFVVVFDSGEDDVASETVKQLSILDVDCDYFSLPLQIKDPGSMKRQEIEDLINNGIF